MGKCAGSLRADPHFLWPSGSPRTKPHCFLKAPRVDSRTRGAQCGAWSPHSFMPVISCLLVDNDARGLVPNCVSFPPTLFDADFLMTLAVEDLFANFRSFSEWVIIIYSCCLGESMGGGKLRTLLLCHLLFPPLWYPCYLPCVVLDLRRKLLVYHWVWC